jgi:hypothetical protein
MGVVSESITSKPLIIPKNYFNSIENLRREIEISALLGNLVWEFPPIFRDFLSKKRSKKSFPEISTFLKTPKAQKAQKI